jgi:predicted DNA-binding transcriptional regulator YafY
MKRPAAAERSSIHSRPPLERMMRIHQAIHSGTFPNASSLARELEVSSKSIQRDLEFMRDRLNLPLEYDSRRFGYAYTEQVGAFPSLQITEGELLALVVAEKALQQYRGTSFEKPLVSALKKMTATLPDTISFNLSEWDQTISFHTSAEPLVNLEIIDLLTKATARRQQLMLSYCKPGSKSPEARVVDPFHLANINGEWFLFGFCHLRQDLRTFVPTRIRAARLTGKTFARPRQFSLAKQLRDSFGVQSGHEEYEVVIWFNDRVADYVREKKWHPSQILRERGGGVELRLRLSSLVEIQRWVLGWGANAVVMKPPELVEAVEATARQILGHYEKPTLNQPPQKPPA